MRTLKIYRAHHGRLTGRHLLVTRIDESPATDVLFLPHENSRIHFGLTRHDGEMPAMDVPVQTRKPESQMVAAALRYSSSLVGVECVSPKLLRALVNEIN